MHDVFIWRCDDEFDGVTYRHSGSAQGPSILSLLSKPPFLLGIGMLSLLEDGSTNDRT